MKDENDENLTVPITTASAERAFSTSNRLKKYASTQSRFNHCLLTNIYKEKLFLIESFMFEINVCCFCYQISALMVMIHKLLQ